jgi:hypothetical protein
VGHPGEVKLGANRIRGTRSFGTPYTKRLPFIDLMIVTSDQIEVRAMFGGNRNYSRSEIRRVAAVSYRVLPLVRLTCLKLTFTIDKAVPLFFRTWRFRRAKRSLTEAGWKVAAGDPI